MNVHVPSWNWVYSGNHKVMVMRACAEFRMKQMMHQHSNDNRLNGIPVIDRSAPSPDELLFKRLFGAFLAGEIIRGNKD